MSKGQNHFQKTQSTTPAVPSQPVEITPPAPVSEPTDTRRVVELHRQCPICFNGKGNGVGTAYCTQGNTRWYRCDRCSHSWKAIIKTEVVSVESRRVDLETR